MLCLFQCEYLGDSFSIEVLTKHTEGELGKVKNIHDLNQQQLIRRQVDFIDIVNDPIPESSYKKEEDPSLFRSKRTNIGPLKKDWVKTTKPISCAYKLVRVQYDKWLIGAQIEKAIQDYGFRAIFLEVNRQAFCWMDDWVWMDMADIRKFEQECAVKQNAAIADSADQDQQENGQNQEQEAIEEEVQDEQKENNDV